MQKKTLQALRAGLLALSAALIVWGILAGEVQTVFAKATRICMECIGLG